MRYAQDGDDPRDDLPEENPRPVVALPRSGVPPVVLALIALGAAGLLFLLLDTRRRSTVARATETTAPLITSPQPLVVPPAPEPIPRIVVEPPVATPAPLIRAPVPQPPVPQTIIVPTAPVPVAAPSPAQPTPRVVQRLTEPALVVDGGAEVRGVPATAGPNGQRAGAGGGAGSDDAAARATVIRSRTDVMAVGTLIPAVLETPIDTARPGLVRAIVSRDTPGFDGRRILVPRGSRLIGEYQSEVRGGQDRVLVTWTRLLRPDGVTIRLGSPASDPLGGAGIPGQVHSFFLQRFAGAVLQSALTVGVNLASRPGDGSVIIGVPTGPVNTIGQQLQTGNDYRPKITVKQGATLNVFVARDLDFSGVGQVR